MTLRQLLCIGVVCLAVPVQAAPTVTLLNPAPDATVSTLTSISVTFNEPVTGVDAGDLEVNTGAAAGVTGSGAGPYVFTFTQPAAGLVSVSWEFDHGIAGIGTGAFVPTGGWTYTLTDTLAPTVAKVRTLVAGQEQDAIVPRPSSVLGVFSGLEVSFSEEVTGVDAADLVVAGVAATSVTGSGAGPYVFAFTQPGAGAVGLQWAAGHGIVDEVGNAFAGGSWTVTRVAAGAGGVIINEFLAANGVGIYDENTDQNDWIELFNSGATPVSLLGWSLTDDPEDPGKWVFPSRTLNAGAYLIVFASGKNRKPVTGNLHTNFKLNENGGTLILHKPDYPYAAATEFNPFPVQRWDYSYGPQTGGALRYFSPPKVTQGAFTPPTIPPLPAGQANGASTLTAITPKPEFSVARGFFKDPFNVVLACTDTTATVRYTLNGSVPTAASPQYTTPLTVSSTTVLRAVAFGTSKVPSEVVTHSYIYLDGVFSQASPPYDNPANATDNTNPKPPSVGEIELPVTWGTQSTSPAFPDQVTNLSVNQIPADYGMDPQIYDDPNKYDDTGAINAATGRTNMDRMKQALREMPILSVVMKTDDMWGATGLYPNSAETGVKPDLTKPCSVELLMPDGTTGFSVPAGIDLHGNASRNPSKCPKHGFTVKFKGDYGTGKLEYALFPESPVQEYDKFILRADFNSSWLHHDNGNQRPKGTRIRDAWCKNAFRDMGREAGHHLYVNLFINGVYWGTYDIAEEENEDFAADYFGGDNSEYDVVEQGTLKNGTITAYNAMTAIAAPIDNPKYEQMKGFLDVPEFADYMLLHFFVAHQDWGDNINKNWYAVRHKNGTFKFLPWDMENLLWGETDNRTGVASPAAGLHPKLVGNVQYRLDFADRVHRHLVSPDGALLPAANVARLNKWTAVMNANAMALESARWGDYRRDVHRYSSNPNLVYTWNGRWFEGGVTQTSGTSWRTEILRLTNYFQVRTNNVMGHLRGAQLYPLVNAPEIRNDATNNLMASQRVNPGLVIKLTNVASPPAGTSNATTFHYTTNGVDPRVYYAGTIDPAATAVAPNGTLTINATTTVKVRAFNGTLWSALNEQTFLVDGLIPNIRITELHHSPPGGQGGAAAEFLELQNTGTSPVDLSNWSFTGIDLVIGAGTVIGPGDRLVFANNDNPATFAAQFPGVSVTDYYGGALNGAGERISLRDATGRTVTAVEYRTEFPWPLGNAGRSIEVVDVNGDPNAPENWKNSNAVKGTPGAANSTATASPIIISEFLANNAGAYSFGGQNPGYVELFNTSGGAVNLDSWMIALNGATSSFPVGTTIGAGDYLLVHFGAGVLPGAYVVNGLPSHAGEIRVSNATNTFMDGVRYGPQAADFSFSRMGGVWTLSTLTPGAANTAATAGAQGTVRLNEWLANPVPGQDDWLELANGDGALPVSLTGMYVGTSTQLFRIQVPAAIAPGGYVQWIGNRGGKAGNVLDFQIPAGGTTLSLFDSSGTPADSQTYAAQTEGVSRGRLPNVTGTATVLPFPSPGVANHDAIAGPIFNEVLAFNLNDENAPWARRAPWVELKNPTGGALSLAGWQLRSPPLQSAWTIPGGASIAAGGCLAIWLDVKQPSSTVNGPHLNFAFGVEVNQPVLDQLELVNPAGQIVDRISFGKQIPDFSIGRLGDNSWALLSTPTRAAANSGAATLGPQNAVDVNEWFDGGVTSFFDYVELYNTSALPVSLAGMYLSDDPSEVGRRKYQIPPLSFIAGNGFATFTARTTARSTTNTGFDIAGTGEYLRLGLSDDAEVDVSSFGLQTAGQSQGRQPEGSSTVATFVKTTGVANFPGGGGPWFTLLPESRTVPAGERVVLSVQTVNAPSVQWRRNGQPIDGATTTTYEIASATSAHDGVYDCVATAVGGGSTLTSPPMTLTVLYTYAAWAAEKGLVGADLPATADADRDGIPNIAEFIGSSNPLVGEIPAELLAPRVEVSGGEPTFLTIDFRLNRRAAVNALFTELNLGLPGAWTVTAPDATEVLSLEPNGDERWRWKYALPPGAGRRFIRLGITE